MTLDPASPHLAPLAIDEGGAAFDLDPRDPSFFQNPYPAYASLRTLAPFGFWRQAGCIAASRHADVSALLNDRRLGRILPADEEGRAAQDVPAHLADFHALEAHSLLELEPPTHTRLRGLVTRAFVSRRVERLAPGIEALANELIDGFAPDGEVELVSRFATPLPVAVIADLIGAGRADAPLFLEWSHAMVAMYGFGRDRAAEDRANAAAGAFRDFLVSLIEHKRRRPGEDLVSALIAAETDSGKLSQDEMISTLVLLLNAGHEATVHAIGNGTRAILNSGLAANALFADEAAGERTAEEILRFDTPLHLFRRVALLDLSLGDGTVLKRGDEIALLLGSASHDEAVFEEPDRFRPERARNPHLSFGGGIHFCVGAPLARLELRLALKALFARLPDLHPSAPARFADTYHFRGLEALPLRFSATL